VALHLGQQHTTGIGGPRPWVLGLSVIALIAGGCDASASQPSQSANHTATSVTVEDQPVEDRPMAPQHVRIELERSGGFTGLRRCASMDTSTLTPDEATRLREAIDRVDLRGLTNSTVDSALPRLDLVVVRGDQRLHASLDERAVPAELRPLLQMLDQRMGPC